MVTSSGLQLAPQPKKQQSISSFFTPKTAAASSGAAPASSAQGSCPGISNGKGGRGNNKDGLRAGGDGGDSTPGSSRRVSAKRALEDDETAGTTQETPSGPKRHRRSN